MIQTQANHNDADIEDDLSYNTARSSFLTDDIAGLSLDDSASVRSNASNSTFSSVQEFIEAETCKKRWFTLRLRERIVKALGEESKIGGNVVSMTSRTNLDPDSTAIMDMDLLAINGNQVSFCDVKNAADERHVRATTGIMTVRTQEESLQGGTIPDMRRLRRRVSIRFKCFQGSTASSSGSLGECSSHPDEYMVRSSSSLDGISLGFHKVMIREYEVVPGCNPSVSCGPPVELGWKHAGHKVIDLEKYEKLREGKRRYKMQMRMPKEVRKNLLLLHGSTNKMIKEASRSAKRGR